MSDQDDSRAVLRENAERLIGQVIRMRESGELNPVIAKKLNIPLGRCQAIVGRLIRHNVIKPLRSRKGARQEILDFIDKKYGPKKTT